MQKGYFSGGQQVRPMPDAVGRDKKRAIPKNHPMTKTKLAIFSGIANETEIRRAADYGRYYGLDGRFESGRINDYS